MGTTHFNGAAFRERGLPDTAGGDGGDTTDFNGAAFRERGIRPASRSHVTLIATSMGPRSENAEYQADTEEQERIFNNFNGAAFRERGIRAYLGSRWLSWVTLQWGRVQRTRNTVLTDGTEVVENVLQWGRVQRTRNTSS